MNIIRSLLKRMKKSQFLVNAKRKGLFCWIPDKNFYELEYKLHFGEKLNWENPDTFSAKLNYLKLYDRKHIYHQMVDKYEVRSFVKDRIGEECLVPIYGVWQHFDDIDFEKLPETFVLKCTHDSGSVKVIEKSNLNKNELREYFNKHLKINYFHYSGREWPYKGIKPRIIAEAFLKNDDGTPLQSNKFYCFNGEPKFVNAETGINELHTLKFDFYDFSFNQTPYYRDDHKRLGSDVVKPKNIELMLNYCKILSRGTSFLRVDLYEVNGKVFFSELTFTPAGGFVLFKPLEWNSIIGSWIDISSLQK